MSENMKRYLEQVAGDEKLRAELVELEKLPPEEQRKALMEHAAKLGVSLRDEDMAQEGSGELSDDELENVSGGSVSLVTVILSTLAVGGAVFWPSKAE